MKASTAKKMLVGAAGVAALGVAAVLFLGHRLELFVLPARLKELRRLDEILRVEREKNGRWKEAGEALDLAANEFIRLQRPDLKAGEIFGLESVRTHEGGQAYLLSYHEKDEGLFEGPENVPGLHFLVLNARGQLVGEEFQVPPWDNAMEFRQGYGKPEVKEDQPEIVVVRGEAAYILSIDGQGIVPRGAMPNLNFAVDFPAPSGPRVSSGGHELDRRWLRSLGDPLATLEDIEALLGSERLGDLFRALHLMERLGPAASRLARSLLKHSNPELRAQATAVLGNDESLWADLLPLASDPSSLVNQTARLALLRAPDLEAARKALHDLLQSGSEVLDDVVFDRPRLLCPQVTEALLDQLKVNEYTPEEFGKFWKAMRTEDLRPLESRILECWREGRHRTSLALWLARLDDPAVDPLLTRAIEEGILEEDLFGEIQGYDILEALLDRERPLVGEGAIEWMLHVSQARSEISLLGGPSGLALCAHLLLIHWKVPGAVEMILTKLREPDNDWLSDSIWENRLPPVLLPGLEALAREQPDRYRERVAQLTGHEK